MNEIRRRVMIIGVDGATLDLILPWVEQGYLPNFKRLLEHGYWGRLRSTIQPTSAPAWVTFMTGVNQGQHGLYDFVRRRPNTYTVEMTNASHISTDSIYELVSRAKRHVVTVNVPYTSPPFPIKGVMVGGPFAPTFTPDLVYPRERFSVIKSIVPDYFILPDYDAWAADPLMDYAQKLLTSIDIRERLSLHFFNSEPWDLFQVVFMSTDEAQHAFWHFMEEDASSKGRKYRNVIRDVYQRVDAAIGSLMAEVSRHVAERETVVIVMSDHGGGPFRWMINLNGWLAQMGYLQFVNPRLFSVKDVRRHLVKHLASLYSNYVPSSLRQLVRAKLGSHRFNKLKGEFESELLTSNIDWSSTQAYALGAGGNIFINLAGREPGGIVSPGMEYENLRNDISNQLMSLVDPATNERLISCVHKAEELYNGFQVRFAPDLVIEWRDYAVWGRGRYDNQSSVYEYQRKQDFGGLPLTGSHRMEGMFLVSGTDVKQKGEVKGTSIIDLAPTILSLIGIQPPLYMEGKVLEDAFMSSIVQDPKLSLPEDIEKEQSKQNQYTQEEEQTIAEHLRSLGYL